MTSRQAEEKTNTLTGRMAKGQADTAFWIKNSFRNENSFTRHLQHIYKLRAYLSVWLLDCGPRCSFEWHVFFGYRLACRNVVSILDVIKCFPRIVATL